jgi:uncharacterized protein YchJ
LRSCRTMFARCCSSLHDPANNPQPAAAAATSRWIAVGTSHDYSMGEWDDEEDTAEPTEDVQATPQLFFLNVADFVSEKTGESGNSSASTEPQARVSGGRPPHAGIPLSTRPFKGATPTRATAPKSPRCPAMNHQSDCFDILGWPRGPTKIVRQLSSRICFEQRDV